MRPRDVAADVLFALMCGDISVPVTFAVNRTGWAPTVQLTAYLRALPADGWLRVICTTTQIGQDWFDEDHTVVDSAGRIVVQTRQLAMVPRPSTPELAAAPSADAFRHGQNRDHRRRQHGRGAAVGPASGGRQVKDLVVAETDARARPTYLAETYSVLVTSVPDAVDTATFVIVAVKPSDVESVVGEIADAAAKAETDSAEQVFVTVAAGVTTAFYESKLPAGSPVIRVMPNAPTVVGAGVSALARGPVRHRRAAQGGLGAVRRGRRRADRPGSAARRRHRGLGFGSGVLLPDGRGAGGRGGRRRASVARRRDRSGVADDGRIGGDVAGTARSRRERGRRCGDRARVDTTAAQLRATVTSPGGTTAAGLRELERWWFAGGRRRGRRGRENTL